MATPSRGVPSPHSLSHICAHIYFRFSPDCCPPTVSCATRRRTSLQCTRLDPVVVVPAKPLSPKIKDHVLHLFAVVTSSDSCRKTGNSMWFIALTALALSGGTRESARRKRQVWTISDSVPTLVLPPKCGTTSVISFLNNCTSGLLSTQNRSCACDQGVQVQWSHTMAISCISMPCQATASASTA